MVHIDVGGTGRYSEAINVNPATTGDWGPIPNLVRAFGEAMPFRFECADLVSVENVPIHWVGMVEEIVRIVKSGGKVRLVNPNDFQPATAAHLALVHVLGGSSRQTIDAAGLLHTEIEVP